MNPSNPGLKLTAIDEAPTHPPTNITLPANTGTLVYSANPLTPSILTSAGGNAMTINSPAATAQFGIAITGLSVPTMQDQKTPGGFWQYSLNGGQTWLTVGNLSFVIAPNGTGADLAGQEFTVTFGNVSKTFEFVTAASGNPSIAKNIPVLVNSADSASSLALAAANAINGISGFNATLAAANGNLLSFDGPTVATAVDTAIHDPAATLTSNRAGLVTSYFGSTSASVAGNSTCCWTGATCSGSFRRTTSTPTPRGCRRSRSMLGTKPRR